MEGSIDPRTTAWQAPAQQDGGAQPRPISTAMLETVAAVEGPPAPSDSSAQAWRAALEKVVPCCVVLKVTQTRAFDTEIAAYGYGTGFVVDKQRGLILTNRHLVTPGPITAEAIFVNREETPVQPVYYDPVHDFGFMRFDPTALEFDQLGEIELAPEAASVGLDIRVVGNDSGEKVSILAGTLARLDRDAPKYKGYSDFNTFYLQAASGTKGGSSGSPVIDSQGRAVAINAGGQNKAAIAYYLPLHRVVRALKLIQEQCAPISGSGGAWRPPLIPRGDLQTTFLFKGFDEVRRLGVSQQAMEAVKAQEAARGDVSSDVGSGGMLVVDSLVPGGPADGVLEPGDVLVKLGGQVITSFLPMEELLDGEAGGMVEVEVQRGGKTLCSTLKVMDLHSVTPSSFLEVAGGAVHALSYQQARNNRLAVGQVYVADSGYLLHRAAVPKHAIITSLAGKATPDMEAFREGLLALRQGQKVPIEWYTFAERTRRKQGILRVDWHWYGPPLSWKRNDARGLWDCTPEVVPEPDTTPHGLPSPLIKHVPSTDTMAARLAAAATDDSDDDASGLGAEEDDSQDRQGVALGDGNAGGTADGPGNGVGGSGGGGGLDAAGQAIGSGGKRAMVDTAALEDRLRRGLVWLDVDIPAVALSDGVHSRCFAGTGVVVHHSPGLGLVAVDRNTVPIGPGDVQLTFGAYPCEIGGRVRFLHPLHNFALVSYDPRELPPEASALVLACELHPGLALRRGERVHLAGLTRGLKVLRRESRVTSATSSVNIPSSQVPRFRAVHEEVVKLDHDFGVAVSGVLVDDAGRMRALWGSYSEQVDREDREWAAGMHVHLLRPWIQRLCKLEDAPGFNMAPPSVVTLDAELEPLPLSKAAQFGLTQPWVNRLLTFDPERRQVLRVRSRVVRSDASNVLKDGDMLLAMRGQPVSSYDDVEGHLLAEAAAVEARRAAEDGAVASPSGRQQQQQAMQAEGSGHVAKKQRLAGGEGSSPSPQANGGAACEAAPANGGGGSGGAAVDTGATTLSPKSCAAAASSSPSAASDGISLTVFREGATLELRVRLGREDGLGTNHLVHWCGAQLQAPHRAVRELGYMPEGGGGGVYVSRWHHGSPASRHGLYALHWILEVNGKPTPDLDTLARVVEGLKGDEYVRVKVCHSESTRVSMLTLKPDPHYWPTWELRLDPGSTEWTRTRLQATPSSGEGAITTAAC